MPPPDPSDVLARLSVLNDELVKLYDERPVVVRAYYNERASATSRALEQGMSVTASKEQADRDTTVFRYEVDRLEADILVRTEERDHLRFLLDHLQ